MRILFLILLIIFAVAAAFIAFDMQKVLANKPNAYNNIFNFSTTDKTDIEKNAQLYFVPNELFVSQDSATQSAEIILDAGNNAATGAQIELKFNPNVFSNIWVTESAASFFGDATNYTVLFNEIDYAQGRISYAVAISKNGTPRRGKGVAAVLFFGTYPGIPRNRITFAPTTLVTTPNSRENILKSTQALTIIPEIPIILTPTITIFPSP